MTGMAWPPRLLPFAVRPILMVALIVAACGAPTQQAKDCGGAADPAAFAQSFSQMEFQGGSPAPPGVEADWVYAPSEPVAVVVVTMQATATRFCAQERSRLGAVVYDQTHTLPLGESRVDLGAFSQEGAYVLRVSVGDTPVRNLTFEVR